MTYAISVFLNKTFQRFYCFGLLYTNQDLGTSSLGTFFMRNLLSASLLSLSPSMRASAPHLCIAEVSTWSPVEERLFGLNSKRGRTKDQLPCASTWQLSVLPVQSIWTQTKPDLIPPYSKAQLAHVTPHYVVKQCLAE